MIIRGIDIPVDVAEEIAEYTWDRGKEKGNEFVCCSPFREEKHPSFSINLETGLWIDFGSYDDAWKKGNLVRLLAYLENDTEEAIEDSLLAAYGIAVETYEDRPLMLNLKDPEPPKTFSREDLQPYLFRNTVYLESRGISKETQAAFVVGYDLEQKAVAFFWRDAFTGKVVNVKFRSTTGKQFYYIKGGQQVKNHLFGLYNVLQAGHTTIFAVESEIDCMYLWENGIPAVAIGGSYLSSVQKELLKRSGMEVLVIATDNDEAGNRLREQIKYDLSGTMIIKDLQLPEGYDVNDLTPEELKAAKIKNCSYSFLT